MIIMRPLIQERYEHDTDGKSFVMISIPQFQKKGAVPNRALTVGTRRTS